MSYQPNSKKVIFNFNEEQKQERQTFVRSSVHTPQTIAVTLAVQEIAIKYLLENNPYETLNELIEKIQILEAEDGLIIDTPEVLAKYIQDPHEFEDLEDLHDDEEISNACSFTLHSELTTPPCFRTFAGRARLGVRATSRVFGIEPRHGGVFSGIG